MGAQLRVYRSKVKSVQAMKKITRAFELIATSRMVKAQQRTAASAPYARAIIDCRVSADCLFLVMLSIDGGTPQPRRAATSAGKPPVAIGPHRVGVILIRDLSWIRIAVRYSSQSGCSPEMQRK